MRVLAWMLPTWLGIGAAILYLAPAWGQATQDAQPTGPEIGRIAITNLVQTEVYNRADYEFDHHGHKVSVTVHYTSTPNYGGTDPRDRVMVTVPEGYVAFPNEILLPENETIEVAIFEAIVG
jgi:hypothetical protein